MNTCMKLMVLRELQQESMFSGVRPMIAKTWGKVKSAASTVKRKAQKFARGVASIAGKYPRSAMALGAASLYAAHRGAHALSPRYRKATKKVGNYFDAEFRDKVASGVKNQIGSGIVNSVGTYAKDAIHDAVGYAYRKALGYK